MSDTIRVTHDELLHDIRIGQRYEAKPVLVDSITEIVDINMVEAEHLDVDARIITQKVDDSGELIDETKHTVDAGDFARTVTNDHSKLVHNPTDESVDVDETVEVEL